MSEIKHVRIKDIGEGHVGQVIEVRGWLRNKPGGKGRYFLWLRDGSGEVQAVAEEADLSSEVWEACENIGIESSLIVQGSVRAHPKQEGVFEMELIGLTVIQNVVDYPISKKSHGVDFLMKQRHLWVRGKRQSAILRIRSELHMAIADFFYGRGFSRLDTPIFTPAACEGTTTLFEVDYHGDTVYLAQSGQLYNEANIGALGQVYCFGPTFRAEKSKTRRHLLEFWMLEMEAAYYDHADNMRFQEELMAYLVGRVLDRNMADLEILDRDLEKLKAAMVTPYPKLRYGEAIALINKWRAEKLAEVRQVGIDEAMGLLKSGKSVNIRDESYEEKGEQKQRVSAFRWGDDFGAPDETIIGAHYDRPVFVTNFPVEIKGFYFKDETNEDGSLRIDPVFEQLQRESPGLVVKGSSGHTVAGSDLVGNEGAGELIGASQREDDLDKLEEKIARHGLPREAFEWYVDLRRYGSVPHSGFGLGFERTVAWLCGDVDNPVHIRETIPFPRMLHHYEP